MNSGCREGLWRALNRVIASYLERLRSKQSQPRSPSKVDVLIFKSEKEIKRAALFCGFWSLSDRHSTLLIGKIALHLSYFKIHVIEPVETRILYKQITVSNCTVEFVQEQSSTICTVYTRL